MIRIVSLSLSLSDHKQIYVSLSPIVTTSREREGERKIERERKREREIKKEREGERETKREREEGEREKEREGRKTAA
jgi:hypothetical protein